MENIPTTDAGPTPEKPKECPPIRVAILTYNSEATIGKTLDSLTKQSDQDFSILIIDDASNDQTLEIIKNWQKGSGLNVEIKNNGSHRIAKGRNLALSSSPDTILAFLDSDDSADSHWIKSIRRHFRKDPDTALISGELIFWAESLVGRAIALNDSIVRRLSSRGTPLFCTANSAFNTAKLGTDFLFDPDFTYAEDIELAARIKKKQRYAYVPEMKVNYRARESFWAYGRQMYAYGLWKLYYSYALGRWRAIDFVPALILLLSLLATIILRSYWPLLGLFVFSLLESLFVILFHHRDWPLLALNFPAWLCKNFCWGAGTLIGGLNLIADKNLRLRLLAKRDSYR